MSYSKLKSLVANVEAIATAMKVLSTTDKPLTKRKRYYPDIPVSGGLKMY